LKGYIVLRRKMTHLETAHQITDMNVTSEKIEVKIQDNKIMTIEASSTENNDNQVKKKYRKGIKLKYIKINYS
jgi:hypothetical protein